ncbi:ABC-type zinc uptake system zinc chaperone [Shewanella sp.]|uniref:ABC-type zinc uptake system zinc chaperone n=1 Tax=Shewanella sp. TaxID=50422 RepID=UPI00405484FA
MKSHIRQVISMGLCALLMFLSVASSAHESLHYDDGASTHCTLCFHQHQLNHLLESKTISLPVIKQDVVVLEFILKSYRVGFTAHYLARGPPSYSIS